MKKINTTKNRSSLLAYCLSHYKNNKTGVFIASSLLIITGLLDSIGLSLVVPALNILVGFGETENQVISSIKKIFETLNITYSLRYVLGITALIMLIRSVFIFLQSAYCGYIRYNYIAQKRRIFFSKLENSSWNSFKLEPQAKIVNLMTTESQRAGTAFIHFLQLISNIGVSIIYLVVLVLISVSMTLYALSSAIIIAIIFSTLLKITKKLGERQTGLGELFLSNLNDAVGLAKYIRTHGKESFIRSRIERAIKKLRQNQFRMALNDSLFFATYEYAFIGFLLLGLLISTRYFDLNASMITLLSLIFFRLFQKTRLVQQFLQFLSKNIRSFYAMEEAEKKLKPDKESWGDEPFKKLNKQINIKNISFSRKPQDIFNNASVKIDSNATTLIVGPSGWGKTTLVDIMIGLIPVSKGSVLYDDINLYNYNRSQFKESIAYVDQNAVLFNDTIMNNLIWANDKAKKQDVYSITKKLDIHDKILKLPSKYNSNVGDLGNKLSGGEKQRISIARALLCKPKILILDEAFNQLDIESKKPILDTLKELQTNTTIIIVTHTSDALSLADKVVEVKQGKIKTLSKNTDWKKYFGAEGESRTRTP